MSNQYSFNGKHVLVTGASGGLGSALVLNLARKGAKFVVTSRSITALTELVSKLPKDTKAIPVVADLSKPGDADKLAQEAIESLGHIDVLFNNAGIGYFSLMEEATEENIRHLFEVNTFSPLLLIKALVPHMKSRGSGRIINIVSAAGRVPIPTVGVYGGSKSALAVMSNTMRLELAPFGIDIINIYPGTTDTSFEENALREEERPGLCPTDSCGLPKFEIASQVMKAAAGPPGEAWLERQGKFFSVASLIWPKFVDKRLASVQKNVMDGTSFKKRKWRLLQVESSIACNLNCIMCPWEGIRKKVGKKGIMDPAVWESIKPYLKDIRSIDFTGGGEPLLQPRLAEWIKDANDAGCETGILTNGVLLNKETAEKLLDAGLDWICVSMDGATAETYEEIRKGSNFNRVCKNLKHVSATRKGNIPKLMINFVMMPNNFHQAEDMIRLAADLGVDQVNFKQCDVIRGDHGKGFGLFAKEKTKDIRQMQKNLSKAKRLAKKINIDTTDFSFTPEEQPVCDQDPTNSMFIRFNGTAAPCINLAIGGPTNFLGNDVVMPGVHYGSLPDSNLEDLWETESCKFYRQRFEERIKTHEDAIVSSLMGGSSNRYRALQAAIDAMPEAPEGCKVCHYLYNI